MNNPENNAAPAIPSLFKDEGQAVDCLARFLDFTNESVRNQETLSRVGYINGMLQEYTGGKISMDSPEYAEAYDFISRSAQAIGRNEINVPLPSNPDAKIHSVFNPSMGRNVLQLNMGEMKASDWTVPHGSAPSQYFHSNRHYARMDDEQRLELIHEQRQQQTAKEHNENGFKRNAQCVSNLFGKNKSTMKFSQKIAHMLGIKKSYASTAKR